MATTAPSGMTARPAPTRARSQGSPAWLRWANVVAPRAAKAAWQSEMLPAMYTSTPSDRKAGTIARAAVYDVSRTSTIQGTSASRTTAVPARARRGRFGSISFGFTLNVRVCVASRRAGTTSRATNRIRNGTLGPRPCSTRVVPYFVVRADATPTTRPPA